MFLGLVASPRGRGLGPFSALAGLSGLSGLFRSFFPSSVLFVAGVGCGGLDGSTGCAGLGLGALRYPSREIDLPLANVIKLDFFSFFLRFAGGSASFGGAMLDVRLRIVFGGDEGVLAPCREKKVKHSAQVERKVGLVGERCSLHISTGLNTR